MPRFSLRALLGFVFLAAIVCAVLFAFPVWLRVSALLVGVLAMPGPLAILARRSEGPARTFGVAGFVAYLAWFIFIGIPGGFAIATISAPFSGTIEWLGSQPASTTIESLNIPGYLFWAGLYAPWIIVPLAGLTALFIHWLIEKPRDDTR